jgi:uncharacterized protein Yka (UPF0111/DUF47 family)
MSRAQGNSLVARIFGRALPTVPDFFTMLAAQSAEVEKTVAQLVAFMETTDKAIEKQIHDDEHAADAVKVANIHILNEAFSTPMDREDIYRAIVDLDEIVNSCKSTVNEMAALEVSPDRYTLEMTRELLIGAAALRRGFAKLGKDTASSADDARIARKAEHAVNKVYRAGLVELFQGTDYINMFKRREIYRHLTIAGAHLSNCAGTLNDVVVKLI